jgi:hypothetical protein
MIFKLLINIGAPLTPWQRWLFTASTCALIVTLWYYVDGQQLLTRYYASHTPEAALTVAACKLPPAGHKPMNLTQLSQIAHQLGLTISHAQSDKQLLTLTVSGSYDQRVDFLQQIVDLHLALDAVLMTDTILSMTVAPALST